MTNRIPCLFVMLVAALVAGCAANQPTVQAPSAQEVEWANKMIALDQQQKALAQKEQELTKLEQQQVQQQAQADLDRTNAATKAWLEQNKEQVKTQLTDSYFPQRQKLLESYGFTGTVLAYEVDDVSVDGSTFIMSQIFLWKNSDDSGELARVNIGCDLQSNRLVGSNIVGTKHLSVSELAAFTSGYSGQISQQSNEQVTISAPSNPAPAENKTDWAPAKNAAVVGGISVAVFALEKWIEYSFKTAPLDAKQSP